MPKAGAATTGGAKGLFVIFGPPGASKSTEAAATFQDSLYITSAKNGLQYYTNDFIKTPYAKERKLTLPRRELCIDIFNVDNKVDIRDGVMQRFSQKQALEHYVINLALRQALLAKSEGKAPPWKNLVIDEAGTFWVRVFEEIVPTCLNKAGVVDTLKGFGKLGEWSNYFVNHLRQFLFADMNVCLVAHAQEPDPSSDKKGAPKFPSQGVAHQICADADGVLYRGFEDREIGKPSNRIWLAHGRQNWLSKMRGLPDHRFGEIKDWPLSQILREAGFEP